MHTIKRTGVELIMLQVKAQVESLSNFTLSFGAKSMSIKDERIYFFLPYLLCRSQLCCEFLDNRPLCISILKIFSKLNK